MKNCIDEVDKKIIDESFSLDRSGDFNRDNYKSFLDDYVFNYGNDRQFDMGGIEDYGKTREVWSRIIKTLKECFYR